MSNILAKVSAHFVLRGLIDPAKEVVADYESKVPEEVRKANLEKLQGSQVVAGRLVKAIQTLKSL